MNGFLAGFAQTYKRMGVNFDHTYLESETYQTGKKQILQDSPKAGNIFRRNEDGSIEVDLSEEGRR